MCSDPSIGDRGYSVTYERLVHVCLFLDTLRETMTAAFHNV